MARSRTAGPAMTSPAAMAMASARGCRRVIAVKKGHCRLCWLQAGIAAAGRRRLIAGDFATAGYWQLSLAGMSRLGSTGPARQARRTVPSRRPPRPAGPSCS